MEAALSNELRLAVACCRFPRDAAARDAVARALSQPIDWPSFERIVHAHRIAGLAGRALVDAGPAVPDETGKRLAAGATKIAMADLRLAAESARLQQRFESAGLPVLFLKGAAVGVLAYGSLGVKQSWDIDLLTMPDSVPSALRLLESDGYRLVMPEGLDERSLARFCRFYHEAVLVNRRGEVVELHWRLSSRPHVMPGVNALSDSQRVDFAGGYVRTLADHLLIPYMIAHGQQHGWSRLKWLADLSALLMRCDMRALERLDREGRNLGLGHGGAAALMMCKWLFDLKTTPDLDTELQGERAAAGLFRANARCLTHPLGGSEIPTLSSAYLGLLIAGLSDGSGWRGLLGHLRASWTQPLVRARYPDHLDFVYHLLRVPLFLLRLPVRLAGWKGAAPGVRISPDTGKSSGEAGTRKQSA